ncbi:MAG: hypothetical protein P8099_17335 [Gemmatimonadota bacterium]|jgi:hypothetical protein
MGHRGAAVSGSLRRAGACMAVVAALSTAVPAVAQQPPARQSSAQVDSLRREVARLQARMDSLQARLNAMSGSGAAAKPAADPLAALRAAAASAAGTDTAAPAKPQTPDEFVGRQRMQPQLNPEVTVTGDVFGFENPDQPRMDNLVPREFEVALQSTLDPYSRAKVIFSYHNPGGEIVPFPGPAEEGAGFGLEEGYAQWVSLPGGLGVTVGQFRQRFGTLNRWHAHALPGQMLPLPYMAFFGEEGLAQPGVSVHWLAPVHALGGTYELWGEATAATNETLFGDSRRPSLLGHFNAFWDLSRSTYMEVGFTGLGGRNAATTSAFGTRVGGMDFQLTWRPPQQSHYREATLRGGAVVGRIDAEALVVPKSAFGGFLIGEYRLGPRYLVGARYEYTQNPLDTTQHSWLVAPTLTWWQSEFVRLRAEFDYLHRPTDTLKLFLIQATFAMGPHKHDTY